jgi:hypothetical protein|tara:strand:- start:498 stop:701 length:204 start_codon:yes stop_codon:yes gene_type:complete
MIWPFSLLKRKEEQVIEESTEQPYYGGEGYYERDMEIVIGKLDLVNSRLENINGRLERIEEFIRTIK